MTVNGTIQGGREPVAHRKKEPPPPAGNSELRTSPRREKLDEHRLSGGLGFPIVGRELDGGGRGREAEQGEYRLHFRNREIVDYDVRMCCLGAWGGDRAIFGAISFSGRNLYEMNVSIDFACLIGHLMTNINRFRKRSHNSTKLTK